MSNQTLQNVRRSYAAAVHKAGIDVFRIYEDGSSYVESPSGKFYCLQTALREGKHVVTECDCPGFSFRGTCRHAQELEDRMNGGR